MAEQRRAKCAHCGRDIMLTTLGLIYAHMDLKTRVRCDGSWQRPAEVGK